MPSSPPDDAKTIALSSPIRPGISKIPSAPPRGNTQPAPPPTEAAGDSNATDEIAVDVDVGASTETTDPNMVEAEAALEAMSCFRRAEQALQRNDTKAALELAQQAVRKDPSQPDYGVLVAWIKTLGGGAKAVEDAIAVMTRAIKEDPTAEKPRFYRAKLYVRMNKKEEAIKDFTELLALNPQHKEAATELRLLKTRVK